MQNNFLYPIKMVLSQFLVFLYCFPFFITLPSLQKLLLFTSLLIFCISVVAWFMASFLYCFLYNYFSSNYCNSNSCCSFTLLKAIAKSYQNFLGAPIILLLTVLIKHKRIIKYIQGHILHIYVYEQLVHPLLIHFDSVFFFCKSIYVVIALPTTIVVALHLFAYFFYINSLFNSKKSFA